MGFTMIELLLSIGLFSSIIGFAVPIYQTFQVSSELKTTSDILKKYLRNAQIFSDNSYFDDSWGVNINADHITLYKGNDYSTRDTSYDDLYGYSNRISFSGTSNIIFSKMTGLPDITGQITLTSIYNESIVITVNEKGIIE